jgi:hypothetical protein
MQRLRRLPLRDALPGTLGALLVFAGIGMIALTESGLLAYHLAAARHGGQILDLGEEGSPQAGLYGYMVRVDGPLNVVSAPRDPDFNQSAQAPVLIRHVEMFQWREITVADAVHYEMDWVDRPLDAGKFMHPGGHANPERFPIEGREFDAGEVHVANFVLSQTLLHALPGSAAITPDVKALPSNLAASFSPYGSYLVTSDRPGDPKLGDLRVSWEIVPVQPVTVVARLDGDQLVPAPDAADGQGYQVQIGNRSLTDTFPDLPMPPESPLPRRLAAVALAVAGGLLLFWRRRRLRFDLLLPVGLGVALIGAVAGVMWMGGEAAISAGWLGVAAAGLALAAWPLWLRRRHPGA